MKKQSCFFLIFYITFFVISCVTPYGNHASALDAFNNAAGFTSSVLDASTNRLIQQNDQFLYQVKMKMHFESSNYIRSLDNRDDYRNFTNDWYDIRDKLFYTALQLNNSNYVKRNLPYVLMDDHSLAVLNYIGDIAHKKWQEAGSPDQSPSTPYRSLPITSQKR